MILNDIERAALARIDKHHFGAHYLKQEPLSRLHALSLIEVSNGVLVLTKRGKDVVRLLQSATSDSTAR